MKINLKTIIAAALIVLVSVWAVDSLRARSYNGTELNIALGRGSVSLNNRSDAPVPVQLTGTGTRIFTVSSSDETIIGSSTREGSGRSASQLFGFDLPIGVSTFTVVNGSTVNLVANSTSSLEATVQSLSASETTTTLIIALVVIAASAFYLVRASGRSLSGLFRRQQVTPAPVAAVSTASVGGQGGSMRAYGDNRADISDK